MVSKKRPTVEEMDERVKLDLPPEVAIPAILETGPHPDGACPHCRHSMTLHASAPAGKKEGVVCQLEGCDCFFEQRR